MGRDPLRRHQSFRQQAPHVVHGRPARWIYLVDRVVRANQLLSEQEVVRRNLGRHIDPTGLCPADDFNRTCRRDVTHMQAGPHVICEQHIASDDCLFGHCRPAAQTQNSGERALVHLGIFGEARFLGVLGDDSVKCFDILQRTPHQHCVVHALAVIAEDAHGGGAIGHRSELG